MIGGNTMKKLMKIMLSVLVVLSVFPGISILAEESSLDERKENMLRYGMYSSIRLDGTVEYKEDISNLPFEEMHARVREDIIDKLTPDSGEVVVWDPAFVLELVPEEFPDLYSQLYAALIEQGYCPNEGVIAEVNIETSNMTRGSSFTKTLSHTYNASGYGTVLVCSNTISWTNTSSGFNITSASGSITGGWNALDKTVSKRNNNTADAYAFYSYTTVQTAHTYSAYCQLQMIPSTSGSATLVVLSEGITPYGIGF